MRGVRRVFRISALLGRDPEREVDDEIAFHLAMREARLRREGAAEADARELARLRFGDVAMIRDECVREREATATMERLMMFGSDIARDAKFAIRALSRSKTFTVAVVLTLALGIGANALIFSVINAVVLQPVSGLPDAARQFEFTEGVSYPVFREIESQLTSLPITAISERQVALGAGTQAERVIAALVSGRFFEVIGVDASAGRVLGAHDDQPGAELAAVLSYAYWQRAFAGDGAIIGRTVVVNGVTVSVIGVAARNFRGLHLGREPAVWLALNAWPSITPDARAVLNERGWEWLRLVGKLPPGMSHAQGEALVLAAVKRSMPDASEDAIARQSALRPAQAAALPLGARDAVVSFMLILSVVTGLVLLTACANIAGLLLSRAAAREREIGVRIALGAGRARLVRQLVTESIVLALCAGIAGMGLFLLARGALATFPLPDAVAGDFVNVAVDTRLAAFAIIVTLVTGVLVGIVPALQSTRPDTVSALKGASLRAGSRQQWLRGLLATAQVAIAIVLLFGTGLFVRALDHALAIDIGFDPAPLAVIAVDPASVRIHGDERQAYYRAVTEAVERVPGVEAVTWATSVPLEGGWDRQTAVFEGYEPASDEIVRTEFSAVGAGYHDVLGIPIVNGRGFDTRDIVLPVAIVNETLARKYFNRRSAVGAHMTLGNTRFQIIGVARDIKYHELNEEPRPFTYLPMTQAQRGGGSNAGLIIRTSGEADAVIRTVAHAVRQADPRVPQFGASSMKRRMQGVLAPQLAGAWLLGVFSLLALAVAAVGIYGVIAYGVTQRTREIGIRIALGAPAHDILRAVVARNAAFAVLGVPAGLVLALILGRALDRFLFGIPANDHVALAVTCGIILTACTAAAFIPARRAMRTDPLEMLRSQE